MSTERSLVDPERQAYIGRAIQVALDNLRDACTERDLGEIESWEQVESNDGAYLRVTILSNRHRRRRFRNDRLVLPATGPRLDPETEGMLYSSGLEERLLSRQWPDDPAPGTDYTII